MRTITDRNVAFLGVDSGGTYLRAALITTTANLVSSADGLSANIVSVGEKSALENLFSVVAECIGRAPSGVHIPGATFALAGVSTRKAASRMYRFILSTEIPDLIDGEIQITNDTFAALWEGASCLPALALVAGTGSHCLGISESGQVARSLGLEYVLSDEGSAYYMGDRVLRAVTRACDGRGNPTILKESLFSAMGFTCISDLYDYIYGVSSLKQEVAGFARFAAEAAERNDRVARMIVVDAVNQLIEAVRAVAETLEISEICFEIITIGGVFDNSALVRDLFRVQAGREFPSATVMFERPNAAIGAAKIARDRPDYDIWRCYE